MKSEKSGNLSPLGVLQEFSAESTMHGLRYVSAASRSICERLCWVVAILACAVLAGVCVMSAWNNFRRSPIIVNVETTNYPLYKLPFPAITICPANNVKKTVGEAILARYLNRSLDDHFRYQLWNVLSGLSMFQYPYYYRTSEHWNRVPELLKDLGSLNLSHFMLEVLPKCDEVFRSCYWIGRGIDCCQMFHIQRTEAGFCYSFNSLTSENARDCLAQDEFLFDDENKMMGRDAACTPRHNIASGSATGLEVFMAKSRPEDTLGEGQIDPNGARILVHHPTAPPEAGKSLYMPDRSMSTFSIKVSPVITVSSSEVRSLDLDTRSCIFPDEHASGYYRTYTLQGCLIECRLQWLVYKCGCQPYFFDSQRSGVPECNITHMWCLANENAALRVYSPPPGYRGLDTGNEPAMPNCSNCLPTCHDSTYLMDYDTVPDSNFFTKDGSGHIDVFYKDLGAIKYRRERAFTFMQLIVSFGGIMSLFLGVSLLSGVEFAYYIIRLLRAFCMKWKPQEKQGTTEVSTLFTNSKAYGFRDFPGLPPVHTDTAS